MISVVKDTFHFIRQCAAAPCAIGAIAPSSRALAETICGAVDLEQADSIIEFGPGTGAFTRLILQKIEPPTKFFAIEHNPSFIEILQTRHPKLKIYHDTAENARTICDQEEVGRVDCIISGLPFAAFPNNLQHSLLEAVTAVLKPGGHFATFGYWTGRYLKAGRVFRTTLDEYFPTVTQLPTIWQNLPPAFIYQCTTHNNGSGNNGSTSTAGIKTT